MNEDKAGGHSVAQLGRAVPVISAVPLHQRRGREEAGKMTAADTPGDQHDYRQRCACLWFHVYDQILAST